MFHNLPELQLKVQRLALAYVLRGKPVPSIIRRRLEDWYSVPTPKVELIHLF